MTNPTCEHCGSRMRQTYAYLTLVAGGCQQVPTGLECTNDECLMEQHRQDLADQAKRDAAALQRGIESGVIVPDDTPEEERYV